MLREQTIVMRAEFGALDHGALAGPTVPQQRSTARKRLHEEMVTRTYVRAREAERASRRTSHSPRRGLTGASEGVRPGVRVIRDVSWG